MGTTEARYPKKPNFPLSFRKAPTALSWVFRPRATSATIRAKPKLTTKTKYTSKKIPPPYLAAR